MSSPAVAQSDAQTHVASRASGFIVSPWYDLMFFITSPLLALVLGAVISGSVVAHRPLMLRGGDYSNTLANCFIGTFIMSHLFIVFFRSHLNPRIFQTHPLRFTVVPLALWLVMNVSAWFAVAVTVLATWWDVYHSSLQTFGIGRIYDMKRDNDPLLGRQLDRWLNLYIYAGPILAGATLMDHVEDFDSFRDVGSVYFAAIPALVESNSSYLTWGVIGTGVPFLVYYLYSYWRFTQQGYAISGQKVALLVTTAIVSIYTWGFNTFGEAFFIMNFFHAWQYFAIVWWSEKKNMTHRLHLDNFAWGPAVMFSIFVGIAVAYGFWAETFDTQSKMMFNLVIVVAIMHFWYDGFIWSVRKKQV